MLVQFCVIHIIMIDGKFNEKKLFFFLGESINRHVFRTAYCSSETVWSKITFALCLIIESAIVTRPSNM